MSLAAYDGKAPAITAITVAQVVADITNNSVNGNTTSLIYSHDSHSFSPKTVAQLEKMGLYVYTQLFGTTVAFSSTPAW